jgi:hypothetical protein
MKISSNVIGNYAPSYVKTVQNNNATSTVSNSKDKISSEEKNFFAGLYPAQKDEIMSYQLYNAKGKVSGVHVGSLFDRRG